MIEESSDENWFLPKSRHDKEEERSYHAALSASKIWIEAVTQKSFKYPYDVRKSLEDGVILCELLNCLKQNCIRKITRHRMARLDNLTTFFSTCQREFSIREGYLFDLHDLDDLTQRAYEEHQLETETRKRLLRVVVCLFWIGKASESFFSGPLLDYSAFSSIINDRHSRFAVTTDKARVTPRPSNELSQTHPVAPPIIFRHSSLNKRSPSKINSPTFSRKMSNDNASNKRSDWFDIEEDNIWRQRLSDWKEKRRPQNTISQVDHNMLQREFNRSCSVPVFPSFTTKDEHLDKNGFNTSLDEDLVFEATMENKTLISNSEDMDQVKYVNANSEEKEILPSIDDVHFADHISTLPKPCKEALEERSSIDTSAQMKPMIKLPSNHEMEIIQNHANFTTKPPQLLAFEKSSNEASQVDVSNIPTSNEQEISKIDDEKQRTSVNNKMSKLNLEPPSSNGMCNDRSLLLTISKLSPLKVSFVEDDLPSEIQDDLSTLVADSSSNQNHDKSFAEQKTVTPPPTERRSTKKYRAPQPPSTLQNNAVKRQISSPAQLALPPPRNPHSDVGNGQEPAVPPRRRRSHVTPSSDGDLETSAIIKSSSADSPSDSSESVMKDVIAAEDNPRAVLGSVKHAENSTPSKVKTEESSTVTSETKPHHTYPPHVSEKNKRNLPASCYSDENPRTLTSNRTLSKELNPGHDLPINDRHYNQLNRYSSQQSFECSVCSKTLCQEVVAIALKELGLHFHVTCFYCWNCKRPLGGRCSSGGLFVSDDRLFCLRCHSFKMGMTVLKLGRF